MSLDNLLLHFKTFLHEKYDILALKFENPKRFMLKENNQMKNKLNNLYY